MDRTCSFSGFQRRSHCHHPRIASRRNSAWLLLGCRGRAGDLSATNSLRPGGSRIRAQRLRRGNVAILVLQIFKQSSVRNLVSLAIGIAATPFLAYGSCFAALAVIVCTALHSLGPRDQTMAP